MPLEYPDLITFANMLLSFQQAYVMPGLTFEFWSGGMVIAEGTASVQLAANNGTQALAQS